MCGVWKLLLWVVLNGCEEEDFKFILGLKFIFLVKNLWNLEVEFDEEEFVDFFGWFENEEKVLENFIFSKSFSDSGYGWSDVCGRCFGVDRKWLIENFLSLGEECEDFLMYYFWKFLFDIEVVVILVFFGYGNM